LRGRGGLDGRVFEYIDDAVRVAAGGDDAAGVRPRLVRGRRIDADDDARERGRLRDARAFDVGALPQRVGALLDDLAVDLLPARARARHSGR
jgi:hypothetical protein